MGYYDFEPLHYDLEFEPDLGRSVFSGRASIRAQCTGSPARTIEMDCAEMGVRSCRVRVVRQKGARGRLHAGKPIEIPRSSLSINEKKERLVIRLPRSVVLGGSGGAGGRGGGQRAGSLRNNTRDGCSQVIIDLEFDGVLNDRLLGFYRSRYGSSSSSSDGDKKTSYMATTQFEASDARRAFPCWDVPSAKATFEISITVPDSRYSAVSNMPVSQVRRDPQSARRTFCFAATPVMSTYLVYLGVGEFAYVQDPGGSGSGRKADKKGKEEDTIIRVITTKHVDRRLARFALKCARTLLGLYESYFGIAYPLPKLDLIAVPDFAAGAMENWGAITFRENLLLYDPKKSSTRTKQLVAEVISHELAHQWFGNLVTMRWWNDLWLNESFATFMATKLLDRMYPEWDMWGQFLTDTMRTGMDLDSMRSTHPIDVEVASPSQIREIFDPISYDKGGCVLRMLERYVGENSFKKGLRLYLRKFKYGNAEGADLWRCIEAESGKPVSRMVGSWLTIPGFPVVHLSLKGSGSKLHARQERYVSYSGRKRSLSLSSSSSELMPPSRGSSGAPDAWPIPFSLRHVPDGRPASTMLFSRRSIRVDLDAAGAKLGARRAAAKAAAGKPPRKRRGTTRAIIANPGRTGFYRVRYDGAMMLDMLMLADSGRLGASDLWALQNDLFAMCVSGLASIRDYLELLDAYRNVDTPVVLADVGFNLSRLFRMSFDSPLPAGEIGWHATEFYRRVHDVVGWKIRGGEPHTVSLLRGPVITSLGFLGDRGVVERCMDMYDALSASGGAHTQDAIHPDLVDPVCTVAAWNSSRRGGSSGGNSSSSSSLPRGGVKHLRGCTAGLQRCTEQPTPPSRRCAFLGPCAGSGTPYCSSAP
ncbi:MAG: M1 family metallopeptidase [Nitrosopumilaceae archaeon]|nr:M1 family metallopeptidase [Nitrosopumilaceae archaeon]